MEIVWGPRGPIIGGPRNPTDHSMGFCRHVGRFLNGGFVDVVDLCHVWDHI